MQSYKAYFSDKTYALSFFTGLALLGAGLVVQFFANNYVTESISEPVTDIILSNTRVYDVEIIFVWGAILLFFISVFLGLKHLKYAPFMMKSVALFTLIRSLFVSLTHISPFPTRAIISSEFFNKDVFNGIFTGNDLFFSGHTGIPFLLALMFWEHKKLRILFLSLSLVFGVVVLLGHLHYSIDVLSAFFITFSIFHICKYIFKKDWELFSEKKLE
jgi:membrane-associated phospholipid phosphatase